MKFILICIDKGDKQSQRAEWKVNLGQVTNPCIESEQSRSLIEIGII